MEIKACVRVPAEIRWAPMVPLQKGKEKTGLWTVARVRRWVCARTRASLCCAPHAVLDHDGLPQKYLLLNVAPVLLCQHFHPVHELFQSTALVCCRTQAGSRRSLRTHGHVCTEGVHDLKSVGFADWVASFVFCFVFVCLRILSCS